MATFAPYFGYLASLLLILALLVNNDLKFRWLNTGGNIAFITYALVLHTIPVLITNLILFCINIFYLYKVYNRKEKFELIEFTGEEKLARQFMDFHMGGINEYFPGFNGLIPRDNLNFVVTRNVVISNMFSARVDEQGDAWVLLNYTLPKYRDYKVGRFIFEADRDFLVSKGVKRIVYDIPVSSKHRSFLKHIGFTESEGLLVKII